MNIKEALLKDKNESIIFDENSILDNEKLLDKVALMLKRGIKIIQYYDRLKSDKANIENAKKIRQLCSMFDALLIINSRADIAKLVSADGVCLDENDINEIQAREFLADDKYITFYNKKNPKIIDFKIKKIKSKRYTDDCNLQN